MDQIRIVRPAALRGGLEGSGYFAAAVGALAMAGLGGYGAHRLLKKRVNDKALLGIMVATAAIGTPFAVAKVAEAMEKPAVPQYSVTMGPVVIGEEAV